jgi:cation diffusion facilitator family transporter
LTAVPLGLAFALARRARNKRYTYGYGRAEDIAGVIIVLMIFITAVEVVYQSILKIVDPQPVQNLGWVIAAAVIGFLGNEFVAALRIRVGRQINSAALVADGLHARTDSFTSLAVLAGAIGVLGFPLFDPMWGRSCTSSASSGVGARSGTAMDGRSGDDPDRVHGAGAGRDGCA